MRWSIMERVAPSSPCPFTIGINTITAAANNIGDVLDFSLGGGANQLGQQQGAYFSLPSPSGGAVSTKLVITAGSALCSADVRVPGLPDSFPVLSMCPGAACTQAEVQSATGGASTVEVISPPTGTCTGSVYVQAVNSPTSIALPSSPSPQTTTVAIGEHVYYSFVGDGSTTRDLSLTASPAGALGNVNDSPSRRRESVLVGAPQRRRIDGSNGGVASGLGIAGPLTAGKTYYADVYGLTLSATGNVATTITWYVKYSRRPTCAICCAPRHDAAQLAQHAAPTAAQSSGPHPRGVGAPTLSRLAVCSIGSHNPSTEEARHAPIEPEREAAQDDRAKADQGPTEAGLRGRAKTELPLPTNGNCTIHVQPHVDVLRLLTMPR